MPENTLLKDLELRLVAYCEDRSVFYKTAAREILRNLKTIKTSRQFRDLLNKKYYSDGKLDLFLQRKNDLFFSHLALLNKELEKREASRTRSLEVLSKINIEHYSERKVLFYLFDFILKHPNLPLINESTTFMEAFSEVHHLNHLLENAFIPPLDTDIVPEVDWLKACQQFRENCSHYIRQHAHRRILSNQTKIKQLLELALELYHYINEEENSYINVKTPCHCILS